MAKYKDVIDLYDDKGKLLKEGVALEQISPVINPAIRKIVDTAKRSVAVNLGGMQDALKTGKIGKHQQILGRELDLDIVGHVDSIEKKIKDYLSVPGEKAEIKRFNGDKLLLVKVPSARIEAAQLELAAEMDLPVNIHLREATEDFFKIMDDCAHLHLRGSLHAFSGSYETFQRVCRYGEWYIGIGGVVTFKKASLAETVRRIPLDRIILETDSPYLTPVPFRGTRNESMHIPVIAAKIAEIKGIGIDEVAETTTASARHLFNLQPHD